MEVLRAGSWQLMQPMCQWYMGRRAGETKAIRRDHKHSSDSMSWTSGQCKMLRLKAGRERPMAGRQAGKQADRPTDGRTDIYTDRQADGKWYA